MPKPKHKKQHFATANADTNKSIARVDFQYNNQAPATNEYFIYAIAILLFLPVTIAPLWTKYGYSPDLHMAFIIQFGVTLLFTVFFFSHIKRAYLIAVPSYMIYTIIAFYGWALLSLIWAYNRFESMISLLDWGAGILMFLLIVQAIRKPQHIRTLVLSIFLTGIAMSTLGVFQFLFDVDWIQQHAKPSATFNNKNMAAQYTLMSIALGFGLFWTAKTKVSVWLYALGTALVALFVHYTNTRGANFATLGTFLFMACFILIDRFVFKRKGPMDKEKWIAISTAFTLFLIMSMVNSKGFSGTKMLTNQFKEGVGVVNNEFDVSSTKRGTRADMWANSTAMIKDYPVIGVGMGNWMVYYPYYQTAVSIDREMSEAIQHINAHNDYIEILSDLGIIGFLLLLIMAFTAVFLALKNFYQNPENPNRYLLLGILLALTGISINAIGSFPFKQPAPILMVCTYLALIASEYARWKNTSVKKIQGKSIIITLSFVALFMTTSAFALHLQWNQSEIHFRLATISSSQKKFHQMIEHGRKSFEYLPLRSRMLNFVGMGYLRAGNPIKAAEYLEKVKEAYPYRNNTLQNLGSIYLEVAQLKRREGKIQEYYENLIKAEENFALFVKIRPDNPRTRRNLGITYYRQAGVLTIKDRIPKLLAASTQLKESYRLEKDNQKDEKIFKLANNLQKEAERLQKKLAEEKSEKQPKNPPIIKQ